MDYFVILCYARSGSTWLSQCLGSHSQIASGGEVFSPNNPHWLKWEDKNDPVGYLDHIKEKIGTEKGFINKETKVAGYKLLYYHAKELEVLNLIGKDVKIIQLKRRHLMSMTSNMLVGKAIENKILNPYQVPYKTEEIEITGDNLRYMQNRIQERYRTWDYYEKAFKNNPYLEVWYERLLENTEEEHRRILNFLEVEYQPLSSAVVKQRSKSLQDLITNYDEVNANLIKAL